jgi:hypothetical protein
VALLLGSRAPHGAILVTYLRFFADAQRGDVRVDVVLHRQHRCTQASKPYSYALPNDCTATASYGARVAHALALAAVRAHWRPQQRGRGRAFFNAVDVDDVEPCGYSTSFPRDAYQVAAFIAREILG